MSQKEPNEFEVQIQEVSDKLNIDIDILRGITPEEIQYLLDHSPFLQIVGPEMSLHPEKVKIIQAESGWDIHDYGDAMSSSPGRLLLGGGNFSISLDDEGGGGDIVNPGKGTIRNQAWMTAAEMMMMAQEKGWEFVTIVDGHDLMKRAAWVKASELGIIVDGFEPSLDDERVRQRVLESREAFKARQESMRPKK